jgi:hypothetical protein
MKKNFKLMLVGLLGLVSTTAWAAMPATFSKGYYNYTTVSADEVAKTAVVELTSVKSSPVQADYSISLPGNFDYVMGDDTYKVTVATINATALNNLYDATSVIIPKEITAIPSGCFNGCTNLGTIRFANESEVTEIGQYAFATTQISDFDFSPCLKLAGLPSKVFVESGTGKTNTFIVKVTVPNSPLFKHINGAFQNLTNLGKGEGNGIIGLENSYVQEIMSEAFSGCDNLKTLKLPGQNLQYIANDALKGSKIENLEINVSSLLYLGGGKLNSSYLWTAGTYTTNLFGVGANTTLKTLKLTGELKGKICKNAFLGCTALAGELDFSGMTFGSTGQIEGEAFSDCIGVTAVKIGNIANNATGGYTIAKDAFIGCTNLATVTLGNITAVKAIGEKAFGENLQSVTIGAVVASDAVFAENAFVWKKIKDATLSIAINAGQYISQTSADATKPVIVAKAFDLSAITGLASGEKYPTIKIGKIDSKGGAFASGAINPSSTIAELTFVGAIAANGLDKPIIYGTSYNGLTTLTFNEAIGAQGIATGAFANIASLKTWVFHGLLAENAVAKGAFAVTSGTGFTLTYDVADIPDYTVNPFHAQAFNAGAAQTDPRFIELAVEFDKLRNNYKDAVVGLNTGAKFDIFYVVITEPTPEGSKTIRLYQNENDTKVAWGRYDLGSFNVEKGPNPVEDPYTAKAMEIARYQTIGSAKVKITMYGIYTDEDDAAEVSSVYMVPLRVRDGKYLIRSANTKLIIIKAEVQEGAYDGKDVEMGYKKLSGDPYPHSMWTELPNPNAFTKSNKTWTNQQLWDKVTGAPDIWAGATPDVAKPATKAIFIMSDPAKYHGLRIDWNPVMKGGAFIAQNWYYALLNNYGKTLPSEARIIWLDSEAEATAIFGVKEVKSANDDDNAIFTVQGVRVNNPVPGKLYIKNGKKFIAK